MDQNDNLRTIGFIANGTTCSSCSKIIQNQAKKIDGVIDVTFNFETEIGYVTFDKTKTNIDTILYKIEEKGYTCYILDESKKTKNNNKTIGTIFTIIGLLAIVYFIFTLAENISMPEISQNMSYGLLFFVGLLTGFHCVSMCGGFVVSYSAKSKEKNMSIHQSHASYAIGKTISYTVIGAIFGLLGSFIAFTPAFRGYVGIFAGLFLIIFGLNMLNWFPVLRKIRFRPPKFFNKFVSTESNIHKNNPFIIGLLNGLMIACGPLQAIYLMAAASGSMIEGAKLLFIFGLGTLPVMLGFGYLTSYISSKTTNKILKASGLLVIILGLLMINNGLNLMGSNFGFDTNILSGNQNYDTTANLNSNFQEIRMNVTRSGWSPNTFILKKGVPVKWIINGKEINGCNNAIQVPDYNLEFKIHPGEQIIEFTPTETGNVKWSCWMGMIPGTFIVKDNIDTLSNSEIQSEIVNAKNSESESSCDGSCGSSTCGGRN